MNPLSSLSFNLSVRLFLRATVLAALLALLAWWLASDGPRRPEAAPDSGPDETSAAVADDVGEPESACETTAGRVSEHPVARTSPGCGGQDGGVPLSLKWLARHQNEDGSWGGDLEAFEGRFWTKDGATSLAMLAILQAGYTHINKDPIDDRTMGAVVKAALKWLMAREPDNALDATLVALALSEAYGMTASVWMRERAQDAVAQALGHQWADGSWGGDEFTTFWAGALVQSARLSDLGPTDDAGGRLETRLVADLEMRQDPLAWAGLSFRAFSWEDPRAFEVRERLLQDLPDWNSPEFSSWLPRSVGMYRMDSVPMGGPGTGWKAWGEALKQALIQNQERDGGWPGGGYETAQAVRNALATLSLEVYYRYSGFFSTDAKSP